jgi:hypothetical protein
MKVEMIGTADLACTMRRHLSNANPESEFIADHRAEPQVTWPRNSVGEYATIAELISPNFRLVNATTY